MNVGVIGWLCLVAAAVIFWLLFLTTALDGSFLYCGLGLVATAFVVGVARPWVEGGPPPQ